MGRMGPGRVLAAEAVNELVSIEERMPEFRHLMELGQKHTNTGHLLGIRDDAGLSQSRVVLRMLVSAQEKSTERLLR
jgi:hypothetical protein